MFSTINSLLFEEFVGQPTVLDQFGFRPSSGVEHALIVFETVSENCLEWGVDVRIANLDLRNGLDKIEYD
jgi:hypothetical protein